RGEDRRVDDWDSAAWEKRYAGSSEHMKQTGRSRLRVAWSDHHAGTQDHRRERALARLKHVSFGLALRAPVRGIDTFQVPGAALVGGAAGRSRGQGVKSRGQDESLDSSPLRVVHQAAGRVDVDGLAQPARITPQADPAGRVDH